MKAIHTFKSLFLCLIFLLFTNGAEGQEKFNITAGWGSPELLNLGVRYQMGQSQLGASAGFYPGYYQTSFSVGADYFLHFGSRSVLSERRPWYGRISFYNYTTEGDYGRYNFNLLVPRIGKDFNLSPKVGISADIGVSLPLFSDEEDEDIFFDDSDLRTDTVLSLGFSFFYRL